MRRFLISALSCLALMLGMVSIVSTPAQAASSKVSSEKLLKKLKVRDETGSSSYERDRFKHWTKKKGCTTRNQVLKTESKKKPKVSKKCSVKSGRWVNEYTGTTAKKAKSLDVDHRVALAEAWRSGAKKWNARKREGFANDVTYKHTLLAVGKSTNRAKSDHDPSEWLPKKSKCRYVARWVAVKSRWKLSVDAVEKKAILAVMDGCSAKLLKVERPGVGKAAKKSKSKKKDKDDGGGGGGSAAPQGNDCPSKYPIKGNASSMIYHVPSGQYYDVTNPEECFSTESAAVAAGYRKSKR